MTFIRKAATSVHKRKCLQKVIGALLMCADDNEDCACVDDEEVECAVNTGEGFGYKMVVVLSKMMLTT